MGAENTQTETNQYSHHHSHHSHHSHSHHSHSSSGSSSHKRKHHRMDSSEQFKRHGLSSIKRRKIVSRVLFVALTALAICIILAVAWLYTH